jgi:hypothetical protein
MFITEREVGQMGHRSTFESLIKEGALQSTVPPAALN